MAVFPFHYAKMQKKGIRFEVQKFFLESVDMPGSKGSGGGGQGGEGDLPGISSPG